MNRDHRKKIPWTTIFALAAIWMIINNLFISNDGDNKENEDAILATNSDIQENETDLAPESKETQLNRLINNNELSINQKVESIVIDTLGSYTNNDTKTLDGVSVFEEENGKTLLLVLNGSDNLSPEMIKKGMWIDTKRILEPISKLPELNDINLISFTWFLPLTDVYGKEKNSLVMSFYLEANTLKKFNWDNFLHNNIPNVVENYFEHSVLKK